MADDWKDISSELKNVTDPNERNTIIADTINRTTGSNNLDLQEMWLAGNGRNTPDAAQQLARQQQKIDEIGCFKIPAEQTFAAHSQVINAPDSELKFDATSKTFKQFDGVIAQLYNNKALTNPNHVNYEDFAVARENLAVLRNVIYSQYFPKGSAGGATEDQKQMVTTIANEIANALQRGSPSIKQLNDPKEGAAIMYDKLVDIQSQSRLRHLLSLRTLMDPKEIWNYPSRKFGLLPREDSALSDGGLSAPPPPPTPGETPPTPARDSIGLKLNKIASDVTARAQRFESVKYLDNPVKEEAIAHARIILKNFARFGEKGGLDAMMLQTPSEQLEYAEGITELTQAFESAMRHIADTTDADAKERLQNNPEIIAARDAMGQLALFLKVEALEALKAEGRMVEASMVAEDIRNLPDEWRQKPGTTLETLLAKIEAGLEVTGNEQILSQMHFQEMPVLAKAVQNAAPQPNIQKANNDLRIDEQTAKRATQQKLEEQLKKEMKANPNLGDMLKTGVKSTKGQTVKSVPTPEALVAGINAPLKQR